MSGANERPEAMEEQRRPSKAFLSVHIQSEDCKGKNTH